MGAIVLDASKVNSYVLPSLVKSKNTMQDAYSTSVNLKNSLPSSFRYKSLVNDIVNQIYKSKKEINDVNSIISKKIDSAKNIESKNDNRASKISSMVSKIGAVSGTIGGAAIGAATGGVVGAAVGGVVGNKVGKTIADTGAKVASKVVSGVKKLGTSIVNGFKWVGSKVTSAYKSATSWISDKANKVSDWVSEKFNAAKDWTSKALKDTGAFISKIGTTIWSGLKTAWTWATDIENWKKVGASIANGVISLVKGLVSLVEAIGDFIILLGAGVSTIGTALYDVGKGIVTGNWDFGATKKLWDGTKSVVAYNWTNKIFDSLYDTKLGKTLDEYAYAPFKSDGMGCKILEGVGYVAGVIVLTIVTFGVGGVAVGGATSVSAGVSATTLAATATAAGVGKYTAEEWNKNSISINYGGTDIDFAIDYEKYSEIEKLKQGESTTISQQITLEDGSVQNLILNITSKGNGEYIITDNVGNIASLNSLNESSTAKGLAIGGIKGAWEGAQWYVGGKIGTAKFSSLTNNIANPALQTVARSGMRVALDVGTGVLEVPFQSLVTMMSEGKNWNEAWQSQGGWDAVKMQAGIAGFASFAGEAFSFKGNVRTAQVNKVILNGDSQLITSTLKNIDEKYISRAMSELSNAEYSKFIDDGIFNNLDNSTQSILIKSLDSTRLSQLGNSMTTSQIKDLIDTGLDNAAFIKIINSGLNDKTFINMLDVTLEENNIVKALNIVSNLGEEQFDQMLRNIDNIKSTTKVSKFLKSIAKVYGEGNLAAQTKFKEFFKNFREHGIKHATKVAEYSATLAKNIDGIDVDEVVYASFIHDFGMRGGYMYIDEEIAKELVLNGFENLEGKYIQIDSLSDSKFYLPNRKTGELELHLDYLDTMARKNHPLNSALSVLTDGEILPDTVDKDVVALLAMTHSKSTSGIKHFSSAKEWTSAVDKLDKALKQYNIDNHTNFKFEADRIKEMIDDPDKFARLQKEALVIRDGDAMAPVVEQTAGKYKGTLMQDDTISVVKTTEKRKNYNTPVLKPDDEYALLVDEIYDKNGNKIRELSGGEYFSKKIHIGEANLEFNSSYIDGDYKATITIKNANQTPNATFDAIEERIGEVNTYTNCDTRSFEIVLPKDAKGTALGKWYEDALDFLKNDPSKKHLAFDAKTNLDNKIITPEEFAKQEAFYENLKIVYR